MFRSRLVGWGIVPVGIQSGTHKPHGGRVGYGNSHSTATHTPPRALVYVVCDFFSFPHMSFRGVVKLTNAAVSSGEGDFHRDRSPEDQHAEDEKHYDRLIHELKSPESTKSAFNWIRKTPVGTTQSATGTAASATTTAQATPTTGTPQTRTRNTTKPPKDTTQSTSVANNTPSTDVGVRSSATSVLPSSSRSVGPNLIFPSPTLDPQVRAAEEEVEAVVARVRANVARAQRELEEGNYETTSINHQTTSLNSIMESPPSNQDETLSPDRIETIQAPTSSPIDLPRSPPTSTSQKFGVEVMSQLSQLTPNTAYRTFAAQAQVATPINPTFVGSSLLGTHLAQAEAEALVGRAALEGRALPSELVDRVQPRPIDEHQRELEAKLRGTYITPPPNESERQRAERLEQEREREYRSSVSSSGAPSIPLPAVRPGLAESHPPIETSLEVLQRQVKVASIEAEEAKRLEEEQKKPPKHRFDRMMRRAEEGNDDEDDTTMNVTNRDPPSLPHK